MRPARRQAARCRTSASSATAIECLAVDPTTPDGTVVCSRPGRRHAGRRRVHGHDLRRPTRRRPPPARDASGRASGWPSSRRPQLRARDVAAVGGVGGGRARPRALRRGGRCTIDRDGAWQTRDARRGRSRWSPAAPRTARWCRAAPAELASSGRMGPIDVVLPILHGPFGEDGTAAGAAGDARHPLRRLRRARLGADHGQGRWSSACCAASGIAVARHVVLAQPPRSTRSMPRRSSALATPASSSRPGSAPASASARCTDARTGSARPLELAFRHDRKVLVEEMIAGREVECGVLGNGDPLVSVPGRDRDRARLRLVRLLGQVRRGRHGAERAGRPRRSRRRRAAGGRPPRVRGLRVQRHGPHRLLRDARASGGR